MKEFNKPEGWFLNKLKDAIPLLDDIPYNRFFGEFNPNIVRMFTSIYGKPDSLFWEPFAGHVGVNHTIDICKAHGVNLIAYDISPCDKRIEQADSRYKRLPCSVDGVIFHPPYLGTSPMSNVEGEISLDYEHYFENIECAISNIDSVVIVGGKVCIVAKMISWEKKAYHLEWIFSKMFINRNYEVLEIYSSIPDSIVILEKKKYVKKGS